ncbi:MAG: hypothetical protein IKP17_09145 [Oscillospiraceae bacterium]|nr:hypothetical protein [Oscillospiraceae bacterium]
MLEAKNFISLSDAPFSRRGSYLGFFMDTNGVELFGKPKLYISNVRGNGPYRQIQAQIIKDGHPLPTVISSTESEVILESLAGSFRFFIGERKFVRIKGTDGLTLRLIPNLGRFGGTLVDLKDGTWQFSFNTTTALLLTFTGKLQPFGRMSGSLEGATGASFDIVPDENGVVDVGVEEYFIDAIHRPLEEYPSYEECVRSYQDEFDAFCEEVCPSLPEAWEPMRRKALWTIFGLMVEPDDNDAGETIFKHSMIKMLHGTFEHVSGWQQAMHVICLSEKDPKLCWTILRGLFDYQDANGRIADILTDVNWPRNAMKPPIQGLALMHLLDNDPQLAAVSREDAEHIYQGIVRWSEFFFLCRDRNNDGLMENIGAVETGWEDAPYFNVGFPLASPDMNSYLAIQLEAQARLGRLLGKDEAVCAGFEARSKEMVQKIIKAFWDGEKWTAYNSDTGKRSATETISLMGALILGKRLPQDIIDKTVATLWAKGKYLTPYGLATEALDSPYFNHAFAQGSIIPPAQLIFCLALEACGRFDLAKEAGLNYIGNLKANGLFHTHNALTGKPERGMVAFDEKFLFWSAWSSSIYLYMSKRYGA